MVRLARQAQTSPPTVGLIVRARRQLGTAPVVNHPGGERTINASKLPGGQANVTVDAASGQRLLTVDNTIGFSVGNVVSIQDADNTFTRLEFARLVHIDSNDMEFDRDLQFAHTTAQQPRVRNQADCFAPLWLDGGAVWEITADHTPAAEGPAMTVHVLAQIDNA